MDSSPEVAFKLDECILSTTGDCQRHMTIK